MKYKRISICLMILLLVSITTFLESKYSDTNDPFYFRVVTETGTDEIHLWTQEDGESFVFLPSYVTLSELQICTNNPVQFGDYELRYGMTCENLELDKKYSLIGIPGCPTSVTFLRSQNIPTMYLQTASGNMEKIHKEKGNEEAGHVRLYTADGTVNYSGDFESIKMRGNNISQMDKKHYSLKLVNDGDLLGMGAAKKWVLLSDAFDPTHFRNKAIFDFASKVNLPYTPENQWVDLYVNGEYLGLYLLCERNEVHPQRVSLPEKDSFLVSLEVAFRLEDQKLPYIQTEAGAPLRIRYSKMDPAAMEQIWQSAENAVFSEDGIDPRTGKHWTDMIDLDSWARKYLLEEIFANVDGGMVSQFYYLDGNDPTGKIHAGPAWDYDMAMANPRLYTQIADEPYEIPSNVFYVNSTPENWGSYWYHVLYRDEQFFSYMTELYKKEFLPLLSDLTEHGLTAYSQQISLSARMDEIRWNIQNADNQTEKVRDYMTERIDFLNRMWLEGQDYVTIVATCAWRTINFIITPGTCIPPLPAANGYEWYYTGTHQPVDMTQPIYKDINITMMQVEAPATDIPGQNVISELGLNAPLPCFAPILLFAAFFLSLILADYLRTKRSDPKQDAKRSKIPS